MSRVLKTGKDYATSIDGDNPISSPISGRIAGIKIENYLDTIIDDSIDLIVSTPRKGSWIIDDYLLKRASDGKRIPQHKVVSEISDPSEIASCKVMVFDDSVHSAGTILDAIKCVHGCRELKVACLLINDDAVRRLENEGISADDLYFMQCFEEYKNLDNGLSKTCQAHYYAYVLVPYICRISVNCSPDYTNMLIQLPDANHPLRTIQEIIMSCFDLDGGEGYVVDEDVNYLRTSCELNEVYLNKAAENIGGLSKDMCKMRVSIAKYGRCTNIVITPMFCPRFRSVEDPQKAIFEMGRTFLNSYGTEILKSLHVHGIKVRKYRTIDGLIGLSEFFGCADD